MKERSQLLANANKHIEHIFRHSKQINRNEAFRILINHLISSLPLERSEASDKTKINNNIVYEDEAKVCKKAFTYNF